MQAAIFALVLSEVLASKLPGVTNNAGYAIYPMADMAAYGGLPKSSYLYRVR
jgi:hypothetical protein